MLISEKHRAVFLHNPKCAGTSISKALKTNFEFYRLCDIDSSYVPDQHRKEIPERYRDFYTFCTYRNPYARFVSTWAFRVEQKGLKMGFEEYAKWLNVLRSHYGLQIQFASLCNEIFRFEEIVRQEYIDTPFGRVEFGHENITQRGTVSSYYTQGISESIVWRKFEPDFVEFGYRRREFQ